MVVHMPMLSSSLSDMRSTGSVTDEPCFTTGSSCFGGKYSSSELDLPGLEPYGDIDDESEINTTLTTRLRF